MSPSCEPLYEPSMVFLGGVPTIDKNARVSESAIIPMDDVVVQQIERRALMIQGWRGDSFEIQPIKTQRYPTGGHYNFHYDWMTTRAEGNRVTSFMIYLSANCTGGGTNFLRLKAPADKRWCDVIDCEDDEHEGVTFKPIEGSAVFWENMYPNGSVHRGTRHASLPVTSGEKIGLNIWGWDHEWKRPNV